MDLGFIARPGTAALYLALAFVFLTVDPVMDMRDGESLSHVLVELFFAGVTLAGLLALLWDQRRERQRRSSLEADLQDAHSDVARWRSEAQGLLEGLGQAIDRQFQRWHLTPAECAVGILLLKGLSHKEVAEARQTSERTVRQQAREIYRKSGTGGRAELSAWFLEDLLLPDSARQHQVPEGLGAGESTS